MMTKTELDYEHEVVRQTRLGILAGTEEPTLEQEAMAKEEADGHVEKLKGQA